MRFRRKKPVSIIEMNLNFAAKTCKLDMEYSECTSKCERTCGTLYNIMASDCDKECYPGCKCTAGKFRNSDGVCVVADECPCIFHGEEHEPNAVVKVDCNSWLAFSFVE